MLAQVPPGQPQPAAPTAPLLSPDQLQNLVGRIALYPDDLLGLVLPAATTPLDIVKGQHFLEKYKQDKNLKPDPSLSQPVLNLLAYPEVISFMNDDLDWTQALGEAVIAQQPDVLQAIQIFRRKAQDAGNLKTDDKQVVVDQAGCGEDRPRQARGNLCSAIPAFSCGRAATGASRHLLVHGLSQLLCSWRGRGRGDDWLCGRRRDGLRAELGQRCGL